MNDPIETAELELLRLKKHRKLSRDILIIKIQTEVVRNTEFSHNNVLTLLQNFSSEFGTTQANNLIEVLNLYEIYGFSSID